MSDDRRVAVLKGGRSLEREVSLRSGANAEAALRRLGHDVLELDVDQHMVRTLLAERPDVRERMGAAGRELAAAEHELARVAERQAAAFEMTAGGSAVADDVLREVGAAAAGVGIAPGTSEAAEIARRLSEVDLGG